MKMFKKVLVFFLYVNAVFSVSEVKFVAIIYRHGERTPIVPYPYDPWGNESAWSVGFGQLTNNGKIQHYELGQSIRLRYWNLLPKIYDPKQLHVQSTDYDRTIMSAETNLAGLYPPFENAVWNPFLRWQPIPVHNMPEKEDRILAMGKKCPAFDKEYKELQESEAYKKRLHKYEDLMKYLRSCTGANIVDYSDILDIYSTLYIEQLNNLTLPSWTHAVFPDKMREPACYSFSTQTSTRRLARMKVAPLFQDIIDDMDNAKKMNRANKTAYLKMSMYSAHDLTIGNFMNALGIYDFKCPVFTAAVYLELLHENANDLYSVRILYRNTTGVGDPYFIKIPLCTDPCPLRLFKGLYQYLIGVDWEDECRIKMSPEMIHILYVLLCGSPIVIIPAAFYFYYYRKYVRGNRRTRH